MNTLLLTEIKYNELGLPIYRDVMEYTGDWWIGLWSIIFAVTAIMLTIGCSYLIDKRYKWFEELANKFLTHAFIVVWLFGFVVYDIGMYTGEPWSLLGNVPMAILHAFGIFILNSDVSAIHDPFHDNAWFMAAFSLIHFLAALVSLVFVLKNFGYSVIAAFKRWFAFSSKETTYIFWGMNDATYYLAKDINRCFSKEKNYRIVVVRANNKSETAHDKNRMERLFNFLSLNSKDLDRLKELNCISTSTYSNLATLDNTSVDGTASIDILHKVLRLNSLCRIIKENTSKTIHLFFLSDNDDENIQAVANLRNDTAIRSFAKKGKVKIYCRARYNSVHRVIEDELVAKNIEVKVVDSSHISVELMKQKPELHPVKYVKVEKDATVSTPFNALVIGFGEVGIDAVRFLYEFGAFVKSGVEKVERSAFSCHVVDQKMNDLAGLFTVNIPSITITTNRKESENSQMINLYKMNCQSIDFYKRLEGWIRVLNYIIIATGDDEMNISLAVRILRLAIRIREDDLSKLRILVRVQHDENGYFLSIARHYNRLWAAEKNCLPDDDLHQNVISSTEPMDMPITLFGSVKEVYTYDHIVNESLKDDAIKFKEQYDKSVNELKQMAGEKTYPIQNWDDEQNDLMQLSGIYEGFAPTFSGVMKLRRVQSQNIANSLHKETKKYLAIASLGEDVYHDMTKHGLTRRSGSLNYSWCDHSNQPIEQIQRVMDVLAQTEHLRWYASHQILGYKNEGDEEFKDEARLEHGCLKEWDRLSEKMKSNDYDVVDVSLNIKAICR